MHVFAVVATIPPYHTPPSPHLPCPTKSSLSVGQLCCNTWVHWPHAVPDLSEDRLLVSPCDISNIGWQWYYCVSVWFILHPNKTAMPVHTLYNCYNNYHLTSALLDYSDNGVGVYVFQSCAHHCWHHLPAEVQKCCWWGHHQICCHQPCWLGRQVM